MILNIIIVILSLLFLLIVHEMGHFIAAKKLGIKVEEFGIGYPPRLFGKKFGETIYSINLIPFGAFVRIEGEEEKVKSKRSFSEKPIWQRAIIIMGGVITFWIVSFLIFSLISGIWGLPTAVPDSYQGEAFIQIIAIAPDSPADEAGIKVGDKILGLNKIEDVQKFTELYKGEKVRLNLLRNGEEKSVVLTPRINPPEEEGAMGIALARIAKIKTPWYKAPLKGAEVTVVKTIQIPVFLGNYIWRAIQGEKVTGLKVAGPVGVAGIMSNALKAGVDNFLMFLSMISIWLAIVNILPIPALDGGRLFFLIIEGIRKKPVSQKIEQKITVLFFTLLIVLMIFVTIKDIVNLF